MTPKKEKTLEELDTQLINNLQNDVDYFDYTEDKTSNCFRFFVKTPSRVKQGKSQVWVRTTLNEMEYAPNADTADFLWNYISTWGTLNSNIVSIKKINKEKTKFIPFETEVIVDGESKILKSEEYPFDLQKEVYSFLFEKFLLEYKRDGYADDVAFVSQIFSEFILFTAQKDMSKEELKKS